MPMNLNDSTRYDQLSGADLEILGAREQAATARALRTAFKPQQGQMVGGWYVKPTWTQNLADAMMQYNNYKNEQEARAEIKTLRDARNLGMGNLNKEMDKRIKESNTGQYITTPAIESGTTNSLVDEALTAGYGSDAQGQPLFDAAPTPPSMPNDGAQAYIPPTATATGNVNANPTNNQYMGDPLANAVRNAPLEGAVAGANEQSAIPQAVNGQTTNPAIPAANQASADGTLPAVTVRPEPEPAQPNRLAQMLRGEGEYAPAQQASVQWQGGKPITGDEYLQWAAKAEGLGGRHLAQDIMKRAEIQGHSDNAQMAANTATANAAMSDLKARQMQEIALNQANLHHIDNMAEKKDQAAARIVEAKRHDDEVAQNKLQIAQIGADARRDVLTQGKLGPGQRFKEGTNEVELIPGTTQYLKAKNDHATDIAARDTIVGINQHVTQSINKLVTSKGFDKIFGIIGGNTFNWSEDAKSAATARNQVVGALEAAGLAINKQANGSIGAMAVAEWPKMATYIAVIKNSDNPKDVKDALVGAKEVLDRTASIATGKYTNEYGGGQFDTSRKSSDGGIKKYNPATGKIE